MRRLWVLLLLFALTLLVGCWSVELPDAQFYAVGYMRAMVAGSQEEMLRLGNVDANTQASAATDLDSRVGDDIEDYVVETVSSQGETTTVTIRLTARDGRQAVVVVDVMNGTGKVSDVELR